MTCAGCGIQTASPSRWDRPKGWQSIPIPITPGGVRYVRSCPACLLVYKKMSEDYDRSHKAANLTHAVLYQAARLYCVGWDQVNPRPAVPAYRGTEIWVRRTVCGCCGATSESEIPMSSGRTPSRPEGWGPCLGEFGGGLVCPDCYAAHEPQRQERREWKKYRDESVARRYREAEAARVPYELQYPEGWRRPE